MLYTSLSKYNDKTWNGSAPVLKLGLPIQTFIHAIADIPRPIHKMTNESASHSQPARTSKNQYIDMLPSDMNVAYSTPIRQKVSASSMAPTVLAGLKYTALGDSLVWYR